MHALLERLFPIRRGLTGNGNRRTLSILREFLPGLEILEIPCGSRAGDWTIPPEWNLEEAWIKDSDGRILLDASEHGLHVASGSAPFHGHMKGRELIPHLHTHPIAHAIPYRTNYYRDDWDFCLTRERLERDFEEDGFYEVMVGAKKDPRGSLSLGELVLPGKDPRSIVVSTYICHPWMANDNLSGVVVTAALARKLSTMELDKTWRFVFAPETLGTLAWAAARRGSLAEGCLAGIVMSTCAGPGRPGWKGCFLGPDHWLDRAMGRAARGVCPESVRWDFDPHGSDERQLSSPGLRIPCVSFHQARYYDWEGYHTSLDTPETVSPEALERALAVNARLADELEGMRLLRRTTEPGEAMLGPRGLYPEFGGAVLPGQNMSELDMVLWLQFLSDGQTPVSAIAERFGGNTDAWNRVADRMVAGGVFHA
ncbi:MAG TPA: DUF4910 domain-containing protein [Fibrobacteria bacterium]|nr:DUF4910 domain-containing protein [Fibrobacteria bacterium]